MRFETIPHTTFTEVRGLIGAPAGVKAKITRMRPDLHVDAMIVLPGRLGVAADAGFEPINGNLIAHKAFDGMDDAERWALATIRESTAEGIDAQPGVAERASDSPKGVEC